MLMKRWRWLCVVIFLVAIAYFVLYNIESILTNDPDGPVVEMAEETVQVSVSDPEEALLTGITATDKTDGDVSDSLVVESISGFVDGYTRYVNYAAFDSDCHVTKFSRTLTYTDYKTTRFTLDKPFRFPVTTTANVDYLDHIHANDCLDGDISRNIHFAEGSSISADKAGMYPVELEVTNSAGDTAKLPVTVTIYENAVENVSPQIRLSQYLVYTTVNTPLNPRDYLQSVTYRGEEYGLTDGRGTFAVDTMGMTAEERYDFDSQDPEVSYDKFQINDPVSYEVPGVYEIEYTLTDSNDKTGQVNLIVVVEEE